MRDRQARALVSYVEGAGLSTEAYTEVLTHAGRMVDRVMDEIAPQPGEQLYKKCERCDGMGNTGNVYAKDREKYPNLVVAVIPCESCNGRGVVPTIVPSPDDGIARVVGAGQAGSEGVC